MAGEVEGPVIEETYRVRSPPSPPTLTDTVAGSIQTGDGKAAPSELDSKRNHL